MSQERDILKTLLLKEELELLDNLKQKLLSKQQFTKEVSKVLSDAIKRAEKQDKQLERSLAGPIKRGVSNAFADNKETIINSLLPIMGQLIRKTVTNSIKQFVADINRTLELGFSAKALKWRWQSIRSGESFAEIVFHNTIRYQITEMFVINHENGLLIQHVGSHSGDILKDNDALSAMLTALQDFIGDSVQSTGSGLSSIEISDKQFIITTGPKIYLAAVIKGSPTERLKQKLQELVENIHSDYSNLIADETQYQNNIEFSDYLQNHLVTKNISDAAQPVNWKPWALGFFLIICGLIYWNYERNHQYQKVTQLSQSIPGFYLQNIERKGGKFIVSGLADPVSNLSNLKQANIELKTKPFISLDTEIIEKRIEERLMNFPSIKYSFSNQVLVIDGEMKEVYIDRFLNNLTNIAGVNKIINNLIVIKTPQVLDKRKLLNSKMLRLKEDLRSHKINVFDYDNGQQSELHKLELIINKLTELYNHYKTQLQVTIIGESDCFGSLSDQYSLHRAELIKDKFISLGMSDKIFKTKIKPCKNFDQPKNNSKKNVFFKVQ